MTLDANFGLPSLPASQILDREGSLWLGLNNGIARYDSENLEIYGIEQGVEGKFVKGLHGDSKGRIWMTGQQGEAIHFRHIDIAQNQVDISMFQQLFQSLSSIFRKNKIVFILPYFLSEALFYQHFQIFFVIYNKYFCQHSFC